MAKVNGPLMSLDARGNYAGKVQFRGGLKGTHAYRPAPPGRVNQAPATEAQQTIRDAYHAVLLDWRALTPEQRGDWEALAVMQGHPMSGWNLYLKRHLTDYLTQNHARVTTTGTTRITTTGKVRIYAE
jgi:hypothetical protein